MGRKYVIDTNVLLDRPFDSVFETFEKGDEIIIPLAVLEELDKFKKGFDVINEYARHSTSFLDKLREKGNLSEGVEVDGKIIRVSIDQTELDLRKNDYQIIKKAADEKATLITQDINERVIADSLNVESKNFSASNIDVNKLYTGRRTISLTDDEIETLSCLDYLSGEGLPAGNRRLTENQYIEITDENGDVVTFGRYNKEAHSILPLKPEYKPFHLTPKKKDKKYVSEQVFALDALLDPSIELVSLIGPSGCGKTLLTLAAGLQQTLNDDQYNKMTIMRPIIPVGNDIGFLPGDKIEKLENWMSSSFDALEFLLQNYSVKDGEYMTSTREKIFQLIEMGKLELEAMTYLRGRSIPSQFIVVDDAQNATVNEIVTIITRASEGTKIILLGDLSEKQIDNHRLTPSSNGLAYTIDKLKGEKSVAHITMETVVRSNLAQLGVEKL